MKRSTLALLLSVVATTGVLFAGLMFVPHTGASSADSPSAVPLVLENVDKTGATATLQFVPALPDASNGPVDVFSNGERLDAAAPGRTFLRCDVDEESSVFDLSDECVRLRIYRSSYPTLKGVTWYDHEGSPTSPCPNSSSCMTIKYNYSGAALVSWDFYFYIAGQGRQEGQHAARAINQSDQVLFTDEFTIASLNYTPTPTASRTPTPTRTPTATPTRRPTNTPGPSPTWVPGTGKRRWLPVLFRDAGDFTPSTPTPTATATPTESSAGWETIAYQDFEDSFPGDWSTDDNNGGNSGEYYWARRDCRYFEGSYSGWPVGGGANGVSLSCGSNYPDNAQSWLVYGPFSLADATAAELKVKVWLNAEQGEDVMFFGASVNGNDFYGGHVTGDSDGWLDLTFDLTDVYTLGDLTGEPQVWIAAVFISDAANNYPEGGYLDNVLLRKCTSASCASAASGAPDASALEVSPASLSHSR